MLPLNLYSINFQQKTNPLRCSNLSSFRSWSWSSCVGCLPVGHPSKSDGRDIDLVTQCGCSVSVFRKSTEGNAMSQLETTLCVFCLSVSILFGVTDSTIFLPDSNMMLFKSLHFSARKIKILNPHESQIWECPEYLHFLSRYHSKGCLPFLSVF